MDASRTELAEAFLREAVYRSRAKQGLIAALSEPDPSASDDAGACGLGRSAAVELGLDAKGAELFTELFGEAVDADELGRVRDVTAGWVERQDALDRKRNHFLKAFRHEHGFDRSGYDEAQLDAFEAGLAAVNEQNNRELRAAAERLLGLPVRDA